MTIQDQIKGAAQALADAQIGAALAQSGSAQVAATQRVQDAHTALEQALASITPDEIEQAGNEVIDAVAPKISKEVRGKIYDIAVKVLDVVTGIGATLLVAAPVAAIWDQELAVQIGIVGTAIGTVAAIGSRWTNRLAGKHLADPTPANA